MKHRERRFHFRLPAAGAAALLAFQNSLFAQMANPPASPPTFYSKNITRDIDQLAVNPRLIEKGSQVLFLIFSGNPQSPKPWDYQLSRADRDGSAAYFLTPSGVLDYNVLGNERGVLVLMAIPSLQASGDCANSYEEIKDWELWYIDLEGEEKQLLESSNNLPLSEGYKILGLADLPNTAAGEIITNSPDQLHRLVIQRKPVGFQYRFSFCRLNAAGARHEIFATAAWQSFSEVEWRPEVVWLDNRRFVTIHFQSIFNDAFPQSEGLFSIVEVDLISGAATELFRDFSIKPFPRLAPNPDGRAIFFQKFGSEKDITELWKLNSADQSAAMVYRVRGELGEPRFSSDGKSVVFTEVTDQHFDIIRLDLDRSSIENVVGR
jgi:hypothetical protein